MEKPCLKKKKVSECGGGLLFSHPGLRVCLTGSCTTASQKEIAASAEPLVHFPRFSRERSLREESWEYGRNERGPTDWRLENSNGKTASRRSEEKEAGEI